MRKLFLFLLVLLPILSLAQEQFDPYYIDVYLVADGDTVDKTYLKVKKPYDNLKVAYTSENEEVAVEVIENSDNEAGSGFPTLVIIFAIICLVLFVIYECIY